MNFAPVENVWPLPIGVMKSAWMLWLMELLFPSAFLSVRSIPGMVPS